MEAEMSDFSRITKSYKRKLKIIEKKHPQHLQYTIINNIVIFKKKLKWS